MKRTQSIQKLTKITKKEKKKERIKTEEHNSPRYNIDSENKNDEDDDDVDCENEIKGNKSAYENEILDEDSGYNSEGHEPKDNEKNNKQGKTHPSKVKYRNRMRSRAREAIDNESSDANKWVPRRAVLISLNEYVQLPVRWQCEHILSAIDIKIYPGEGSIY